MRIDKHDAKNLLNIFSGSAVQVEVQTGALIYNSDEEKRAAIFLVSGEIRIIDRFRTFGNQTLTKISAPAVLGFSNALEVPFLEEARAITDCSFLRLNLDDCGPANNYLKSIATTNISPCEWPFILKVFNRINLDAQIPKTLAECEQFHKLLKINEEEKKAQSNSPRKFIYLDAPSNGFEYGDLISQNSVELFFNESQFPRLLKIGISSPENTEYFLEPKEASSSNTFLSVKNIPLSSDLVKKDPPITDKSCYGFKYIPAKSRVESFESIFTTLCSYYNLPTRRDTIAKAAQLLDHDDIPWDKRLLPILENFGLSIRQIRVNIDSPLRVPTPSLWTDKNGYCNLIVYTEARHLTVINPISGIEIWSREDASLKFNSYPLITSIDIGLHTPQKRFGIHWLFPYIARYKIQLVEVFAASFLTQLFALATPLLFQQIIDRVISKGAGEALAPLVVLMLILVFLEITFSTLRTFQFVEVSNRIDIAIGSSIVSRMLRINTRFFDKRPVGELSSRLNELENIRRFLTGTALTVVLDAIFSLLYFAVMFFYSPLLTLVIICTLPPLLLVTLGITPVTQRLIRARAEATSRTQSLLVEILSGIQTIKLQNAELTARRKWEDRHLNSINKGFKAILANTSSSNALQLINKISSIIIIGLGASLVLKNQLTLGELIAFRIISGYVTQPMMRLASTWQSFQEMSLSLERVGDVVNQSLETAENEDGNISMPDVKGNICFDSVSFSYSSTTVPVLSSINLSISQGEFVGFVGQSGCGKSTLLKMVPRLYRPTAGRIMIDSLDISKVELYSLRSQLGFVPQDCMLFEGTIFSNISLNDPQISSERVIRVAKLACAHDFIMSLPYGYNTPVGEKGAGLSGGQRQRIALARMLLEEPSLVILDEATSALDVDTERQVVANLREHFKNTTLLMITHRLSTLIDADKIAVLHSGRIDAIGNHADLIKQKGRYYALYQSQFGEPS